MSTMEIVLAVVSSVGAGGFGLVRYWLRLRFLRGAFERNGDRKDLEVAGKVTAPGWLVRGELSPWAGPLGAGWSFPPAVRTRIGSSRMASASGRGAVAGPR
jgi:hypothetical protein